MSLAHFELDPIPLNRTAGMKDACFSYGAAHLDIATNSLGYLRDFGDGLPMSPLPSRIQNILREKTHAAH